MFKDASGGKMCVSPRSEPSVSQFYGYYQPDRIGEGSGSVIALCKTVNTVFKESEK